MSLSNPSSKSSELSRRKSLSEKDEISKITSLSEIYKNRRSSLKVYKYGDDGATPDTIKCEQFFNSSDFTCCHIEEQTK